MLGLLRKVLKDTFLDGAVGGGVMFSNLPKRHSRRVQRNKKRKGTEFKIDAQILGLEIKDTMLDLGLDVKILPRKTQEAPRKHKLTFQPIQLHMVN